MSLLRRHKQQQPLAEPPSESQRRVTQRLAELAGEYRNAELAEEYRRIEDARQAEINRQLERAGVKVWAGFLREEKTVALPLVNLPKFDRE